MKKKLTLIFVSFISGCAFQSPHSTSKENIESENINIEDMYVQRAVINFLDFIENEKNKDDFSVEKNIKKTSFENNTYTLKTPIIPVMSIQKISTKKELKPVIDIKEKFKPVIQSQKIDKEPPQKLWRIERGTTLRDSIIVWASSEKCRSSEKWMVMWTTPVNYRIDAPLQFDGDFMKAMKEVLELYQHAKKPLYATTNTQQCLIRIEDTK